MFRKLVASAAILVSAVCLSLVGVAGSASAAGSPSVTANPPGLTGSADLGWIALAIVVLQFGVGFLAVRAARNQRRESEHSAG